MSDDWHDQERRIGSTAFAGEAGMGALFAIAMQAGLSVLFIAGAAVWNGGIQATQIAGWLSAASCGQFVWLFPAFLISLWFRPGFAGGLALGSFFGSMLGFSLSCLAAVA